MLSSDSAIFVTSVSLAAIASHAIALPDAVNADGSTHVDDGLSTKLESAILEIIAHLYV